MREQLRVVAAVVAVLQPEILAPGTSPWVDAVANLSAATGVYREFWIIVPARGVQPSRREQSARSDPERCGTNV